MINNLDFAEHQLFAQAFKYAPIGMALLSIEGHWLHVNSSLSQILGYSESELAELTFQDITHPDDLSRSIQLRERFLFEELNTYQVEKRYIHKNGFDVWISLTLSIVRDESKRPLFFMAQFREMSSTKERAGELIEKVEQLESFLENSADAIWMVDLNDTILEVNPTFEEMFGWSQKEIKGKKLPMIPDFLWDVMDKIHQGIKRGETVVGFETIRKRKDGSLLDVEATLSPIRDRKGIIVGMTGICRDITRRKQAEEELKSKTEQLESFIENSADAIWMVDINDKIINVNPTFEKLFGWKAGEIKGEKLPLVPPFLQEAMDKIHQGIKRGETVVGFETIRQRKDGTLLDVEATLSPIRNRKGNIVGMTGICRDVTPRKRAEEELKAKTTQLESFIENNADAILIFNNEGTVERINATFEKTFGYPREAIMGMEWQHLPIISGEYLDEARRIFEEAENGQSVVGLEMIGKQMNGESLNLLVTSSPILDGKGMQDGWSVTLRDITNWKQAQELLQNSEKLSVAGQLAAGIAHEIRNPMTSIKGFIDLMKAGFGEKKKYFDIMSSEIERIELILSELLILAKPQSIKYERKDIRVLLSQVLTLLDTQAILNNVQFVTEFKPGVTHIYCDENQLKQVFINFVKNSIESMPNGGIITIQVNGNSQEEMLIRLTDQGCGIPKEVLSKLGQPFYTTKEKGTGLGFMVSKQIIENHSGQIHVESELGQGTTIEIKLPLWSS
ncbi:PAS domain S-box protein [Ammoniphilus sp. 3BR4]|uniref:PAS domain S-box protein n=1 Tax=Ammoniphilus sp. 3BR4 TaxID=3158265 RepID=UPI003467DC94